MTACPEAAWHDFAACNGVDPAVFFPASNGQSARAKAICAGCPVTGPCLADQLAYERTIPVVGHLYGVFGGLTALERKEILDAERLAARAQPVPAFGRRLYDAERTAGTARRLAEAMAAGEKRCTGPCGLMLPLTAYGRTGASWRGVCKACRKAVREREALMRTLILRLIKRNGRKVT